MTAPFKAYSDFMALRAHFTTKYDYIKYQGGMKWVTESSYEKRKDKYFFEKLAKHKDYKDFLVANLLHNPKIWVTALAKPQADDVYIEWKRKMQSLTYIFRTELKKIPEDSLFQALKCNVTGVPILIEAYLTHEISLETLCILVHLTGIKKFWDKVLNAPEWKDLSLQVEKYTPFISFDEEKMKEIAYARFEDAMLFISKEC